MGKRGPKPKRQSPAAGASRRPVRAGAPAMPPDLTGEAAAEWRRIVPELEAAGCLSVVDRAAVVSYCWAWATLAEANRTLGIEGKIIEEPMQNARGEVIGRKLKLHPAVQLQKEAFAQVKAMLGEFGLTPGSRDRSGAGGGADGGRPGTASLSWPPGSPRPGRGRDDRPRDRLRPGRGREPRRYRPAGPPRL